MKNELILVNKIEKRLMEKREPIIFPLSPTHRKELRQLRDSNIGGLSSRLNTIKILKTEEYVKKYQNEIKKEMIHKKEDIISLNKDWEDRIKKIDEIINKRRELEEKSSINDLSLNHAWSELSELKEIKLEDHYRKYDINFKEASMKIAKQEFNDKYSNSFEEVQKRIDDINTKYEEAINFGDLEIVKELYYIMKKSESFFEKVSKLKV